MYGDLCYITRGDNFSLQVPNEVFGTQAWVIISNIVQPLTILYYFHCTMCLAEVIHTCYTSKYIGIVRRSKRRQESPYGSSLDLMSNYASTVS